MNTQYFDVFFELYGKKMKTTVRAVNANQAMEIVKSKIVFHKVAPGTSPIDKLFDQFEDIINPKK